MEWTYTHLLLPVLNVLYIPCDWLLGWTEHFSPIVSISFVGALSGIAVILVQKYASDQRFLGQAKADLELLKAKMKAAKAAQDPDGLARARALTGRISGKYMWAALKPSLWTVPLIGVIGLWTGSRLGFLPIHPGDRFEVTAHFEDNAKGFAYIVPTLELTGSGPLIAPLEMLQDSGGLQARWTVRAEREGDARLTIRHGEEACEIPIPVARTGGRPPEPVTTLSEATPGQDRLAAVEIKLAPSLPAAWWNLTFQWGGLYLIVAGVLALGLRYLLKVN